jgi:hypothetical protein
VLLEHWIGGGRRQRWLTTASKSCGGAPARRSARGEERQCKCGCVNARVSALGAQGRASSRGGGTASEGRCWQAGSVHGALGRRRRDVEGRGGASRGREAVGAGAGGHVARSRAAHGSWSSGKWPARVAGARARAEQRKDWR